MAIDGSKECYFDINIYDKGYTTTKTPLRVNTCFALLKKIEIILENNLPFINDSQDEYASLTNEKRLTFLKEKTDEIVTFYSKAKLNFLFGNLFSQENEILETSNNILNLITPPKLPLTNDIAYAKFHEYQLLPDLMAYASTNRAGKHIRNQLILEFAEEAGFEGQDVLEASSYLKEFTEELEFLSHKKLIPNEQISYKDTTLKRVNKRNTMLNIKNSPTIPFKMFEYTNFYIKGNKIFSLFNFKEKEPTGSYCIPDIPLLALFFNKNDVLEYSLKYLPDKHLDLVSCLKWKSPPRNCIEKFNNFEGLKILLNNGINICQEDSIRVLMRDYQITNLSLLKFFLDYGSDVNDQSFYLQTPLHYLCNYPKNNSAKKILKMLLEYGANINKMNYNDYKPFDLLRWSDPNGLAPFLDPSTTYFDVTLENDSFYMTQSSKKPHCYDSALPTLKKIEKALIDRLSYNPNHENNCLKLKFREHNQAIEFLNKKADSITEKYLSAVQTSYLPEWLTNASRVRDIHTRIKKL